MQTSEILPDMPIVCSQGGMLGEVDHMEGEDMIKIKKDSTGMHHYIPMSMVSSIEDGQLMLSEPGDQVKQQWSESPSM